MFSLKMVTFCKATNCPSSQELLAFQNGEVSLKNRERIEAHFAVCEFCASEAEFYAHYPQSEEKVATVEIPIPLLELAEALLGNEHKDFSALNKLLCEKDGVKI
jgi:4'-phosphopantetheinyl transferase EntD